MIKMKDGMPEYDVIKGSQLENDEIEKQTETWKVERIRIEMKRNCVNC